MDHKHHKLVFCFTSLYNETVVDFTLKSEQFPKSPLSHRFCSLFLPNISLGNITQSDKLRLWKIWGGKMLRVHFFHTLKLGWAKQRATAIIEAVRGPDTPMVVKNSEMFGVSLNGTGRLASRSPVASLISKRKYETLSFPVSCWEMNSVMTNSLKTKLQFWPCHLETQIYWLMYQKLWGCGYHVAPSRLFPSSEG